jgi:hypothetical protein
MFGRLTGAVGSLWSASAVKKVTQPDDQQHTVKEEVDSEYGFVSVHVEEDEDAYIFVDDSRSSASEASRESDFEDVDLPPSSERDYDVVDLQIPVFSDEIHEGSLETHLALIRSSPHDDQGKKDTVSLIIRLISSCCNIDGKIRTIRPKTLNLLASILNRDLKLEKPLEECKLIIQSMIQFMSSEEGEIKEDQIRSYLDLNTEWNREQISHILKWCKVVQKLNKDDDLKNQDLSGLNLKGLDFSNVDMRYADLTRTGLSPADFAHQKKIRQAKFSK